MKNRFCIFILGIFSVPLFSQDLGISGSLVALVPAYENEAYTYDPSNPLYVQHKNIVHPGIRLEGNYILKGFNFPVSSFNGFGVTYILPYLDSAAYSVRHKAAGLIPIRRGLQRISMLNVAFRFGYEIPQSFNDFLLINVGWGGGVLTSRSAYLVPEDIAPYTFIKSDFEEGSFAGRLNFTGNMEVFTGIVYELEKYSIIAQYSFIYGFNDPRTGDGLLDAHVRHQISAGIFYPLKRF